MRAAWVFIPTLALLSVPSARAAKALRTQSGAASHWERSEVRVAIDAKSRSLEMSDASVEEAIDGAANEWNKISQPHLKFVRVIERGALPDIRVVFRQGVWPHAAGLLANTQFDAEVESGVVAAALIEVNECDYRFVGPNELEGDHFDLQAVLTHELGHALGLGHSEDPGAVMFSSTGSPHRRRPNADDRAGIAEIYGASGGAPMPVPATVSKDGLPPTSGPLAPPRPPGCKMLSAPRGSGAIPTDMVQMVRLDGAGSRVMYISDPVILPAMGVADTKSSRSSRKPGARGHKRR